MSRLKFKILLPGILFMAAFSWVLATQGPLAPVKVTSEKMQTENLAAEVFGVGLVEARHGYTYEEAGEGRDV
jgi:HlyD family secretion protein